MSSSTITINVYVGSDGVTVGQSENVSSLPTTSEAPGPLASGAPAIGMVENQGGAPAPTESDSATVSAVPVDTPMPDEAVAAEFDNTDAPAPDEITSE